MSPAKKPAGPMDRLRSEAGGLVDALAQRAVSSARDKLEGATGRLTDYVENGGGPGLMSAVTGAKSMAEGKGPTQSMLGAGWAGLKEKAKGMFGGGRSKSGGKQKLKLTNIVESIDVGVPIKLAYNQWTQYEDFPSFTKKVEQAQPQGGDEDDDEMKVRWKAQVFWSHREWEATIVDQRPDERIVWRSQGQKGHVDGAVTFHELGPTLTRILLVMEYHPQGFMEHTGNLWRAQGRRARLELKHFQRHVMAHALLEPDDVEGWRGTIEDCQVVQDHETALRQERGRGGEQPADEIEDEDRDRADEGREPEDEVLADEDEARDDETGGREDEAELPEDEDEDEAQESGSRERSGGRRRGAASGDRTRPRRPAIARAGRPDDAPQRTPRRAAAQRRTRS